MGWMLNIIPYRSRNNWTWDRKKWGGHSGVRQLVLFGAGKRCYSLCRLLKDSTLTEVWITDNDSQKWGTRIEGYVVQAPEVLLKNKDIEVCITIADELAAAQISVDLKEKYGVTPGAEVKYNSLILELLKKNNQIKKAIRGKNISVKSENSVLFDCYMGLGLGGVEAWTMDLCSAMLQKGLINCVIISDIGQYRVPESLKNNIVYVDIDHQNRFSIDTMLDLIDVIISKLPCQVVTCTTDEIMVAAYLVKCVYPDLVKIISVVHNSNEKVYSEYMDFKECIDVYIGVSMDIKQNLIKCGIDAERVFHMTCPFYCEKSLNRTYTIDMHKPIRIGYAGRMDGLEHSQKRMDLMMKLIVELVHRGINFHFEFAGDGPAKKIIENFIRENQFEGYVKLLGVIKRKQIPDFWKEQDLFVNVADYEGRSISLLEAMANGAIPVVTETSGVKEEIINGYDGYYVPLGDYLAIADKIEYLSIHRDLLSEMGRLSHDKVYPESSMEKHVHFWKEILHY